MTEAERRAALEQVATEVRACTRCRLHEGRTAAVPGEGHPSTEVLLVGEAPGLNEDRQGRPFVGAAGGFLEELLGTIGWSRDEVFITNVVKCRPPQNRDPEPEEIAACAPFLRRQAEILDPALVMTLGRHSMGRFMPGARIGQVHGTTAPAPPDSGAPEALVFAMYHPAAALHQASLRQTLLDDMTGAPRALMEARRRRDDGRAEAEPLAEGPAGADEADDGRAEAEPLAEGPAGADPLAQAPAGVDEPVPPTGPELGPAEPAPGGSETGTIDAPVGELSGPSPGDDEPPADASTREPAATDGPPSRGAAEHVAIETGQAGLPPALAPAADPSATDQMTLF